jgi:DNA-binding response OmpR family regulator
MNPNPSLGVTAAPRILIAEDEATLRGALERGLEHEGYGVVAVADGHAGLALAQAERFDCMIFDVMLPGRSGIEMVTALRELGVMVPILLISALGATGDRVRGLDFGADDYISKPFEWAELLARLRACLRRGMSGGGANLRSASIEIDRFRRRLVHGDREIELTDRESELLCHLVSNPGRVISRDELSREVWKEPAGTITNIIDVYVTYVRRKLERVGASGRIQTVRGAGYCWRE